MAPKDKQTGGLSVIGSIIIAVLQFIALVLMAVGTPYDVLKLDKFDSPTNPPNKRCYSVWGMKECGGKHPGAWHDADYRKCGVLEACLKAAASFCCVALFAILLTLLFAVAYSCKMLKTRIPIALTLVLAVVSTAVPWATIAGLYHNNTCSLGRFKDRAKYGAGFGLFVAAFCIEVISFVISLAA